MAESQSLADRGPLCGASAVGFGTLTVIGPVSGHRAAFGTTKHDTLAGQLEERARVHNETETHTENAPVTLERGNRREAVAQRLRELGTARYSRQPAPPLGTHRA